MFARLCCFLKACMGVEGLLGKLPGLPAKSVSPPSCGLELPWVPGMERYLLLVPSLLTGPRTPRVQTVREENTCHKQGSPTGSVVCSLRIVPDSSSRKGYLAFSRRHFNANAVSQTEEARQMWAIWQGCSSFVSKCERLVGRILNITLVIHKHFIFQARQGGKGCI